MANGNYSVLKDNIDDYIKQNGDGDITGQVLQTQLFAMINSLGAGYQFMGVAKLTPTPTDPGSPDQNVFYVAFQPGIYSNFGNQTVADGEIAILKWNGSWTKEVTGAASAAKLDELGQKVGESILYLMVNRGQLNFEQGTFNNSGANQTSTTRVRSVGALSSGFELTLPFGYLFNEVFYYSAWTSNDNFTFVVKKSPASRSYYFDPSLASLVRFSVRKSDNSTIVPSDLLTATPNFKSHIDGLETYSYGVTAFPYVGGVTENGGFGTSASECHTDYLRVSGAKSVSAKVHGRGTIGAFYDKDLNFIQTISGVSGTYEYIVQVPSGAEYVVFGTNTGRSDDFVRILPVQNALQYALNLTGFVDPTTAYGYDALSVLDKTSIGTGDVVADGTETTDFQEGRITDFGFFANSDANYVSTFIPVHPSSKYKRVGSGSYTLLYDENKHYIGMAASADYLITPSNCRYVRRSWAISQFSSAALIYCGHLSEGETPPSMMIAQPNGECLIADAKYFGFTKTTNGIRGNLDSAKNRVFGVKFKLPADLHSTSGEYELLRFKAPNPADASQNPYWSVRLVKAPAEARTGGPSDPNCPVPVYKAGIKVYSSYPTPVQRAYWSPDGWKNVDFLGVNPMAFRFAGDCSQTANQDIRLSVSATTLRIYHATGNTTIASFTLADYDTMKDLYDAILAATASGQSLEDFEVKWFSLDLLTPSDIIPCDVALVAEYYRDNSETTTAYDSFPYYFTCKDDGTQEHTLEVIISDDSLINVQVCIDGYMIYKNNDHKPFNAPIEMFIGTGVGSGVTFTKLFYYNNLKYTEPIFRVLYWEGIKEGLDPEGLLASQRRVAGTAEILRRNGFACCSMSDTLKILDGELKTESQRLVHISHDDSATMVVLNDSIRETYLRSGFRPSIAFYYTTFDNLTDANINKLRAMLPLEFEYHLHSGELSTSTNISYLSYDNLVSDVDGAIAKIVSVLGVYPIAWSNHRGPINYNTVAYLRSKGFRLIMASNVNGLLTPYTRFCCSHKHFPDSASYVSNAWTTKEP